MKNNTGEEVLHEREISVDIMLQISIDVVTVFRRKTVTVVFDTNEGIF